YIEDVVHLVVENRRGQPERRNVDPHQPTGLRQLLVNDDGVAERHQVVGDGERGWTGADQRDALAILFLWRLRNEIGDVVTQICRDSLEPADRDGLSVNASST